jgi:hypothetical protein
LLRENGYDSGPRRGPGTWADFVQRHAARLWDCDFISVRTWTLRGVVEVYAQFFFDVGSRRVYLAGTTASKGHPQQAASPPAGPAASTVRMPDASAGGGATAPATAPASGR